MAMLRPASRRDNDRTTNDSYRATNGILTRSGWSAFDHRTEWFTNSLKASDTGRVDSRSSRCRHWPGRRAPRRLTITLRSHRVSGDRRRPCRMTGRSPSSALLAHLAIHCGCRTRCPHSRCTTIGVQGEEHRYEQSRRGQSAASAPASEPGWARATDAELGNVARKLAQLTNHVVFETPRRPARCLGAPRNRDGLTRAQIAEALTHTAFYADWPKRRSTFAACARRLTVRRSDWQEVSAEPERRSDQV